MTSVYWFFSCLCLQRRLAMLALELQKAIPLFYETTYYEMMGKMVKLVNSISTDPLPHFF